ncbi:MAG: response regulator [Nitrospinae bacterium]|nr:response regulator [Nitrospinota bacterium]
MNRRILIVEDDKKNRILLHDILKYHGYEVIEAVNGEEGIKKAKEYNPFLILMDIQMEGINGIDAVKILKDSPETKDIKVIAVTSFAMKGDMENIMRSGFDDYISKPVDTRQLPDIITRHLT